MNTPLRGIPDSARQKDDLSIRRVLQGGWVWSVTNHSKFGLQWYSRPIFEWKLLNKSEFVMGVVRVEEQWRTSVMWSYLV